MVGGRGDDGSFAKVVSTFLILTGVLVVLSFTVSCKKKTDLRQEAIVIAHKYAVGELVCVGSNEFVVRSQPNKWTPQYRLQIINCKTDDYCVLKVNENEIKKCN